MKKISRPKWAWVAGRYDSALPALIALLDDPQVAGHAVSALRKHKRPEARPHLERFTDHCEARIRKAAVQAVAAIDKLRRG